MRARGGVMFSRTLGFLDRERAEAEKSPPNKYYYLSAHYNGLKGLHGIINLMCKNKIQVVLTQSTQSKLVIFFFIDRTY